MQMKGGGLGALRTKVLVAIALLMVAVMVFNGWDAIVEMLGSAKWGGLILSIFALSVANSGVAVVFSQILGEQTPAGGTDYHVVGSFLLSQPAKYVPGKVWSTAMQAAVLHHREAMDKVVVANLELVVANILLVTGAGVGFAMWQRFGAVPALFMLGATWVLGAWVLGFKIIPAVSVRWLYKVRWLRFLLPGDAGSYMTPREKTARLVIYAGVLIFLSMYCFGWWLLVRSTTGFDAEASMAVVAALSLSYIVGVMSMLPAGLGAREGALLLLAPAVGVSHTDMAALAITSRAAILLVDAIGAGAGAALLNLGSGKATHGGH